MITWPHAATDWAPLLSVVEPVYLQLVTILTRFERVLIVAHDAQLKQHIVTMLNSTQTNLERVHIVLAPCDDTWARDHGPLTLECNGETRPLNFTFNGWGHKFACDQDNHINDQLTAAHCFNGAMETVAMVLEGGAIEVDGNGTLMTTRACLLNKNRNPHWDEATIERKLQTIFNIKQVLWLDHGAIEGDDTDSHIDTLARFAPNNAIVYQGCNNTDDPHYAALQQMAEQLRRCRNAMNQTYRLFALPWPNAKYNAEGDRLPATYANFLIINGAVLVPTYDDEHDQQAIAILREAFPERQVIGINCLPIIEQSGSLHCITMQLPAGTMTQELPTL